MARVFADRGSDVLLFRGDDGLDELTTTTTSTVWQVRDGAVTEATLDPQELGIPAARPEDLRGGEVADNVAAARRVFAGRAGAGAGRRGAQRRGCAGRPRRADRRPARRSRAGRGARVRGAGFRGGARTLERWAALSGRLAPAG